MSDLFTLSGTVERDPAIEAWLRAHDDELGVMTRAWEACLTWANLQYQIVDPSVCARIAAIRPH